MNEKKESGKGIKRVENFFLGLDKNIQVTLMVMGTFSTVIMGIFSLVSLLYLIF